MTGIVLSIAAVLLIVGGFVPRLRVHRSLIWGGATLACITLLYPWPGNDVAGLIFAAPPRAKGLVSDAFGVAWWVLGAWLVRTLFQLILRRTLFPNDNQPHARRLFADLAAGFVYVIAFVGIMETVLDQPISTLLATSGVLAIVLGLALQNTLADVFSGLAINVERPFGAGDWITLAGDVEGRIIEINWRATRLRTLANDIIVIPNSVVAKAVVISHRPLNESRYCTVEISINQKYPPSRILPLLLQAARTALGCAIGQEPTAYASAFSDTLVVYQLSFGIALFSQTDVVRSEVISAVADALAVAKVDIGAAETAVCIRRPAGRESRQAAPPP